MRKEEKYAGWRPRYRGVIDAEGYSLEYLSIDDPAFPELIGGILRQQNKKGSDFIMPRSGTWKEVLINGSSEPLYLDLMNLECGGNTLRRVERFVNTYGLDHEIEKPSSDAYQWQEVWPLLSYSKLLRDRVGQILDGGRTGLMECGLFEGMERAPTVLVDLVTAELVCEAREVTQFALLQIADVFSRGLTITNCEVCGAYMTPSRNTRTYCGNTCRKRANREKTSPAFLGRLV